MQIYAKWINLNDISILLISSLRLRIIVIHVQTVQFGSNRINLITCKTYVTLTS